jgi:hypothetical protein
LTEVVAGGIGAEPPVPPASNVAGADVEPLSLGVGAVVLACPVGEPDEHANPNSTTGSQAYCQAKKRGVANPPAGDRLDSRMQSARYADADDI